MVNSIVRGHKACWSLLAFGLSLLSAPAFSATNPAANVSSVFSFDLHITGAGVVEGTGGALFGTTMDTSLTSGGTIFKVAKGGGSPEVIYQLKETDGFSPQATLLVDGEFLYGTTYYSPRIGLTISYGSGTVFRVKQDGSGYTTLHTFGLLTGTNAVTGNAINADGMHPVKALIQDATYLYGVTPAGGANGSGTVFRVRKSDGQTNVLHAFNAVKVAPDPNAGKGELGDGAYPSSSLTLGQDGRLYGVTSSGGAKLRTSAGTETGTTVTAGTGTIYSLDKNNDPNNSTFTTLYSFDVIDDTATTLPSTNASGAQPTGALLELTPGVFIGTASSGGNPTPVSPATTSIGYGTIFKFTVAGAGGALTTLYNFNNNTGASPTGNLVKEQNGNLIYGFTNTGSTTITPVTQYGVFYSIDPTAPTPADTFEVEHALTFAEGTGIVGNLTQDAVGDLYASVQSGNACTVLNGSGYGGVIRFSVATGGSSTGYANCTQPSDSGGGVMSMAFMSLLGMLGLVPVARRWLRVS